MDLEEEKLFESRAQSRADAVLKAAKYAGENERSGRLYTQFKEEFKDVFEEQVEQKLRSRHN